MRNIITIVFLIAFTMGYAQRQYKRADNLFERMEYIEAAAAYEAIIQNGDRSSDILKKAGDAHYFNTNMEAAHRWYDMLVSEYPDQVEAEYIFRYAHALQGVGDNRSAKRWMKKFAKHADDNDLRSKEFAQDKISLNDILDLEPQFVLRNLSINTKFSDFGPMFYNEKLVYSSAADTSNYTTRRYHWNQQPFLNLLVGNLNASRTDATFEAEFSKELNSKYHEATVSFSPDMRKLYFTRNNYDKRLGRDEDGVNHLKLYSADIIEENGEIEWINIIELPFNSDEYSVGHPSVSPDGKKLYFVSDMPGSIGATDIFVVDILGDNQYTQPKNLGAQINTYGREMFPYITEKALYFASDGHLGLGGLDVFESNYTYAFDTPINLGAPLNSNLDDFGFIIKEKENKGFVCSNRKSGKGDDDIYSFERFPVEKCIQTLNGNIRSAKTGDPISGGTVSLYSNKGDKVEEVETNSNGEYVFASEPECGKTYKIEAGKSGFKTKNENVSISKNAGKTTVPITLESINELIVEEKGILKIKIGIVYFDLGKHKIRNDAAIELDSIVFLMQEYPNMTIKIESHTDSRAPDNYNLKLSDNRAKATRDYIISKGIDAKRIESAVGYGETRLINECQNEVPCPEIRHQQNRRSEFIIVQL
ncbi:OmpA family protein [Aquimarina sp. 2-A2]|uniref:OmpA family protein n=1 Tax=Aquimarina sp. 2-A2 TaxID=3382644 RepID=UPI00387EE910